MYVRNMYTRNFIYVYSPSSMETWLKRTPEEFKTSFLFNFSILLTIISLPCSVLLLLQSFSPVRPAHLRKAIKGPGRSQSYSVQRDCVCVLMDRVTGTLPLCRELYVFVYLCDRVGMFL